MAFGLFIALTPHAQHEHTAWSVYAFNTLATLLCAALVFFIKYEHKVKAAEPVSARSLVEGFRFVYQNKIILGVITLDFVRRAARRRGDIAPHLCEGCTFTTVRPV